MCKARFVLALTALALVCPSHAAAERGSTGRETFPAPNPLVDLTLGWDTVKVWPFTGTNFSGEPSDPINLIFWGDADPRVIRQVLLELDGNRTAFGFPNTFPFNCTWTDGIGAPQTAWAESVGWTASSIELECGVYSLLRVHLRLFREGPRSVANAHFETLIPGTTTHEVLGWELAEQIVLVDLVRSGALAGPPSQTPVITPAPTYRAINPLVFNGLPGSLRVALGLPVANQSTPVPIPSDGKAAVFVVSEVLNPEQHDVTHETIQPFNQIVPRPFCASGPLDYIRVVGPLSYVHRIHTNPSGRYEADFTATGVLQVTPVNPLTGQVVGPTVPAVISELQRATITDERVESNHVQQQTIHASPLQLFFRTLDAGHSDRFLASVTCAPQ